MFVCESCHKKSSCDYCSRTSSFGNCEVCQKANDCYDCHGYGLTEIAETEIAEAVIRLIKTERELVRNAKEENHGPT